MNVVPFVASLLASPLNITESDTISHDIIFCEGGNATQEIRLALNVTDHNSFFEIKNNGNVSIKLVVNNQTGQHNVTDFGNAYLPLTLQSNNEITGVHFLLFNLSNNNTPTSGDTAYQFIVAMNDGYGQVLENVSNVFSIINRACQEYIEKNFVFYTGIGNAISQENTLGFILNITVDNNGTGSIRVLKSATSPSDYTDFGQTSISTFLQIDPSSDFNTSISNVRISIYYNPSDIPSTVTEANLSIYTLEGTSWIILENNTVDTENNIVSASTTHFSVFGVFTNSLSTSGSVGGSPSGGGGNGSTSAKQPPSPVVLPLEKKIIHEKDAVTPEPLPSESIPFNIKIHALRATRNDTLWLTFSFIGPEQAYSTSGKLRYAILNSTGYRVFTDQEEFAQLPKEEQTRDLLVGKLSPGKYTLILEAQTGNNEQARIQKEFVVSLLPAFEMPSLTTMRWIILATGIVLLVYLRYLFLRKKNGTLKAYPPKEVNTSNENDKNKNNDDRDENNPKEETDIARVNPK